MSKEQKIGYMLRLYQLRSDLLKLGVLQPVKWMIEKGMWREDKNNHNYLSGRIQEGTFLDALDRLKNQLDNE